MQYKSEAELQSKCTIWYRNTHLDRQDDLILIYNNPPNARMGAILRSLGMRRGPSDQLYFAPINPITMLGKIVWVEYKIDGRKQTPEQIAFEKKVKLYGCDYVLIRDETEFQLMIKKYENHGG
jgi:hypothetical protein